MSTQFEMIDTHIHLVPGVDDGAENMELALSMAWDSFEQGVTEMILTPHSSAFDEDAERTKQQFAALQSRMFRGLKVHPGCEVYCEAEDMERILRALDSGKYPTMNETKYVLAEFFWGIPEHLGRERVLPCVKALIGGGYKPIIAHAERYRCMQGNMALMDELCDLGCLLQLNTYSLEEELKDAIKNWARELALQKKIHLLGTDAHRRTHRPPRITPGLQWLYANCGQDYADEIAWANARRLLCRA